MNEFEHDFGNLRRTPEHADDFTARLQEAAFQAAIEARQEGRSPSLAAAEVGLLLGLKLGSSACRKQEDGSDATTRVVHDSYSLHELPQIPSSVNAQGEIRLSPKVNPQYQS